MHLSKLGHAYRRVTITFQATRKNGNATRAVHRLECESTAILGFGRKHVVAIVFPVAGNLPNERSITSGVLTSSSIGVKLALAHVGDELLEQRPTLAVPEDRSGRTVVKMKQVELCAKLAMVALSGLFQAGEIRLETFFIAPAGAVNALQHGITRISTPVSAGYFH